MSEKVKNEISVVVQQDPGKITWNFEELKRYLASEMDKYRGLVYTDDTIKEAKGDQASLRALSKQIEDRRKEVKAKCLEPYGIIEAQAKELTQLIDEPIQEINRQIQAYETKRKEGVKKEIAVYWGERAGQLPEEIRTKVCNKIYDARWLNVTTSKKTWKEAIDSGISNVLGELDTIRSFKSDFEEDMVNAYYSTLSLQDAIRTMNSLQEQRQRVLEMERRKKEEQERREAERLREQQGQNRTPDPEPVRQAEQQVPEVRAQREEIIREQLPKTAEPEHKILKIYGDDGQINKVIGYIKFAGLKYEEVEG